MASVPPRDDEGWRRSRRRRLEVPDPSRGGTVQFRGPTVVRGRIVPFFRSLPRGIAPLSLDAPVGRSLARASRATAPARRPSFGDLFATPTLPDAGDGAPGSAGASDVGSLTAPAGRFAGSFFGVSPTATRFGAATGPVTLGDIARASSTTVKATVGAVTPVVGVPNAIAQLGLALFGFVSGLIQGVTSPKPAPGFTTTTETLATATTAAKSAITTRGAPDPVTVLARAVQAVVAIITGFVNPKGFNPTVFGGVPGATATGVASAVGTGFTSNAADAQAAANLGFSVHMGLVPGTFTISNPQVGAATGNAPPGSTNFGAIGTVTAAPPGLGLGGGDPSGPGSAASGDPGDAGIGGSGDPGLSSVESPGFGGGSSPSDTGGGDAGDGGVGDAGDAGDGPAGGSDGGVGGAGE